MQDIKGKFQLESTERASSTSSSRDSDNLHRQLHGLSSKQEKRKEPTGNVVSQYTGENKKIRLGNSSLYNNALEDPITEMQKTGESLIFVSNRGGTEYKHEKGKLQRKQGAGGLSTALATIKDVPVEWYSAPMGQGDRDAITEGLPNKFVDIDPTTYNEYYNGMSNSVLWPILHEMPGNVEPSASQEGKFWDSYIRTNRAFADAIDTQSKGKPETKPIVMIQDYHLLLASRMIREKNSDLVLQHFIHTPWPESTVWKERFHPDRVKHIHANLLGNDIIGFQTGNDADNFLKGVQEYLPDARVNLQKRTVSWDGYRTEVRVYPISISVNDMREKASGELCKQNANLEKTKEIEAIQSLLQKDRTKIMRADRMDPTKNIDKGFQAYDQMLEKYPDTRGNVDFLAFLAPSREDVPIYQQLKERVLSLIKEINEKHATSDWQPINLFTGHDQGTVLKALKSYDVLLVNPIKDGMNLVAKEGAAVNQKDGVIVLSKGAGAFEQLKDGVEPISNPDSVEETADAMYRAITKPLEERKIKAETARKVVEDYDLPQWLNKQLHDLLQKRAAKQRSLEDA